MGILTVPNFYDGNGSRVAIPDRNLPIAILNHMVGMRPVGWDMLIGCNYSCMFAMFETSETKY